MAQGLGFKAWGLMEHLQRQVEERGLGAPI